MNEMLKRLHQRRDETVDRRKDLIAVARRSRPGDSDLNSSETEDFRRFTAEISGYDDRISELQVEEERANSSNNALRRAGGGLGRPASHVYGPEERASYFADLVAVSRQTADYSARERVQTFDAEQRSLNRADGSGGAFVPPAFLVSDYVGLPRPGRVTADLLTRRPLPRGTDVLNIPRVVTGTATAIQAADNDPVQAVDLTDSSIQAPVRTIAGQQDIAIQLLDQSPVNFDEIIMADLMAAYSQQLDNQVLSGTGAGGQHLGLRNVTGIETVTWTSSAPTAQDLQKRVADAVSRISGSLFAAPNAIVMHPRRWAWLLTQNDTSNRPLVVPQAYGPNNAQGVLVGGAEGLVGSFAGLPVYIDANIPKTGGVGANEDLIMVLSSNDTFLYESGIKTRVLQETLSGTLTVRIQLYAYSALATRQAKSVAVISGTGLVPPLFV